MSGFRNTLGVVRMQVAPGEYVAAAPQPIESARSMALRLLTQLGREGDGSGFVAVEVDGHTDVRIRARAVLSVEVVPTEDPGAGSW